MPKAARRRLGEKAAQAGHIHIRARGGYREPNIHYYPQLAYTAPKASDNQQHLSGAMHRSPEGCRRLRRLRRNKKQDNGKETI